jgi:hypothetical protein
MNEREGEGGLRREERGREGQEEMRKEKRKGKRDRSLGELREGRRKDTLQSQF